jgi:hypothetical protein
MTYLSFAILATVPLDYLERAKSKKVSKGVHLQCLPIIDALREINNGCSQMLLVNCLIRKVKHILNSVDCMGDIALKLRVF